LLAKAGTALSAMAPAISGTAMSFRSLRMVLLLPSSRLSRIQRES
jgi:hypothetical protein